MKLHVKFFLYLAFSITLFLSMVLISCIRIKTGSQFIESVPLIIWAPYTFPFVFCCVFSLGALIFREDRRMLISMVSLLVIIALMSTVSYINIWRQGYPMLGDSVVVGVILSMTAIAVASTVLFLRRTSMERRKKLNIKV